MVHSGQKSIIAFAVLSIVIILSMAPPDIDREDVNWDDEDYEDNDAYWMRQKFEDFQSVVVLYIMIIGIAAGSIWKESKEVSGVILFIMILLTIGGYTFITEDMESIGWYIIFSNLIFLILLLVVYFEKEVIPEPKGRTRCIECGKKVEPDRLKNNRCPLCFQRQAAAAYRYRSRGR